MEELITIATFQYPHEGYIIQGKLESEGIASILKDELTIQTDNLLSNALGGVRLQIYKSDLEKALPILITAGIVIENQFNAEPSSLENFTSRIPIIKKWPYQIRLIPLIVAPIFLILLIYLLMSIPSKAERLADKARFEEYQKERMLTHRYLPYIDSLIETNPKYAVSFIKDLFLTYPNHPDLHDNLGVALFYIDSFQQALNQFQIYMNYQNYEWPRTLANIAYCKIKLEDYEGAIEDLIKAAEINWDFTYDLAVAYESNNDLVNAEIQYSKYIDKWRSDKTIYEFPKEFLELEKKVEKMRKDLNYN